MEEVPNYKLLSSQTHLVLVGLINALRILADITESKPPGICGTGREGSHREDQYNAQSFDSGV